MFKIIKKTYIKHYVYGQTYRVWPDSETQVHFFSSSAGYGFVFHWCLLLFRFSTLTYILNKYTMWYEKNLVFDNCSLFYPSVHRWRSSHKFIEWCQDRFDSTDRAPFFLKTVVFHGRALSFHFSFLVAFDKRPCSKINLQ